MRELGLLWEVLVLLWRIFCRHLRDAWKLWLVAIYLAWLVWPWREPRIEHAPGFEHLEIYPDEGDRSGQEGDD